MRGLLKQLALTSALVSNLCYADSGDCNLLAQVVSATAMWRDNGVPIAKAQANVDAVLVQMPATDEDKNKWHQAVVAIYGSKVSPDQISEKLEGFCRQ